MSNLRGSMEDFHAKIVISNGGATEGDSRTAILHCGKVLRQVK